MRAAGRSVPAALERHERDRPQLGRGEADDVGTTTLDAILEGEVRVDLLKIDCEGAEYGILLSSAESTYGKVQRLVVELHAGRQDEIVSHLADRGLRLEKQTADNVVGGVFWFDRAAGAA